MKKHTFPLILTITIVLIVFTADFFFRIPQVYATTETQFMRSDQHEINGLTAYKLITTQGTTAGSKYKTYSGNVTVQWGIKVAIRKSDGTQNYISGNDPVAVVERSEAGEGIQSATWSATQTALGGSDAVVVEVYEKGGTSAWSKIATFITEHLNAEQLNSATWTVYYWTKWEYSALVEDTYGYFKFGTSDYNSRIEGFTTGSRIDTYVVFPTTSSLQFQNAVNRTVTLHVLNGVLNSTTNSISIHESGGYFCFTALNDTQIEITYEGVNVVQVSGDQGHEQRIIPSGTVITVNKGNNVRIGWTITLEVWLPVTLALGIAGFGMLVASPTYTFYKIKQREYSSAFCWGFLMFIIGIGLVIVWLWG